MFNVRNYCKHLTRCKQRSSSNSFKHKITYQLFTYKSYIYIYIYIDLALNKPLVLICHKTPTKNYGKECLE